MRTLSPNGGIPSVPRRLHSGTGGCPRGEAQIGRRRRARPPGWPRRPACEPVRLALEGDVRVRDAVRGQVRRDGFGLRGRDDRVVEPLQQQHRAGGVVHVPDRRPLGVQRLALRQRPDQPVEIAGFEVVRLRREPAQVGHAEVRRHRGEDASRLRPACPFQAVRLPDHSRLFGIRTTRAIPTPEVTAARAAPAACAAAADAEPLDRLPHPPRPGPVRPSSRRPRPRPPTGRTAARDRRGHTRWTRRSSRR